jgi:hypothetical protein
MSDEKDDVELARSILGGRSEAMERRKMWNRQVQEAVSYFRRRAEDILRETGLEIKVGTRSLGVGHDGVEVSVADYSPGTSATIEGREQQEVELGASVNLQQTIAGLVEVTYVYPQIHRVGHPAPLDRMEQHETFDPRYDFKVEKLAGIFSQFLYVAFRESKLKRPL